MAPVNIDEDEYAENGEEQKLPELKLGGEQSALPWG
jgi:hypothetical protein